MCTLASRYMQKRTQSYVPESEPLEEFSTSLMSPASSAGTSSWVRRSLRSIISKVRRLLSSVSPWTAFEEETMSDENDDTWCNNDLPVQPEIILVQADISELPDADES